MKVIPAESVDPNGEGEFLDVVVMLENDEIIDCYMSVHDDEEDRAALTFSLSAATAGSLGGKLLDAVK